MPLFAQPYIALDHALRSNSPSTNSAPVFRDRCDFDHSASLPWDVDCSLPRLFATDAERADKEFFCAASVAMKPLSGCRLSWLLLAASALIVPALINGTIFLFPDSIGYFYAGDASLDTIGRLLSPHDKSMTLAPLLSQEAENGISTSRSIYYGIPFVLLYRMGGEWLLALVQTLIALTAIAAAFRRLSVPTALQPLVLIGVVLAGLGFFTTVAMPDVFAGLAVLALAMLLTDAPEAAKRERWLWLLLLLVCCLTHKAIFATIAAMTGLYALWHSVTDRRWPHLRGPLAVLILALIGHSAVNFVVERISGQKPLQTPFALARIVGDGTAQLYLARRCPEVGYRLCDYVDRFPMTENTFLWSRDANEGIMNALPLPVRKRISAEATDLVLAAIVAYPLHQIGASLGNLVSQFGLVGVTEYALGPRPGPKAKPELAVLLARYEQSMAGHQKWPFNTASLVMKITYIGSFGVLLVALWRLTGTGWYQQPQIATIVWIMLGLVVNAAVSGVVGGVFDRYQGRVAWLVPLVAVAALAMIRRPATAMTDCKSP
jgi:hypothetical protein